MDALRSVSSCRVVRGAEGGQVDGCSRVENRRRKVCYLHALLVNCLSELDESFGRVLRKKGFKKVTGWRRESGRGGGGGGTCLGRLDVDEREFIAAAFNESKGGQQTTGDASYNKHTSAPLNSQTPVTAAAARKFHFAFKLFACCQNYKQTSCLDMEMIPLES